MNRAANNAPVARKTYAEFILGEAETLFGLLSKLSVDKRLEVANKIERLLAPYLKEQQ